MVSKLKGKYKKHINNMKDKIDGHITSLQDGFKEHTNMNELKKNLTNKAGNFKNNLIHLKKTGNFNDNIKAHKI